MRKYHFQKLPEFTVEQWSFNKIGYCIIASKVDNVILINSSDAMSPRNTVNYLGVFHVFKITILKYHKDLKCPMVYSPMAPSMLVSPISTDLI